MDTTELFNILQPKVAAAKLDPTLSGTVSISITGTDPAQWQGQAVNGRASLEQGELVGADLTVTASSETALGIFQKTVSPMMAFMTGKIKISGDMAKIALLKNLIFKKK